MKTIKQFASTILSLAMIATLFSSCKDDIDDSKSGLGNFLVVTNINSGATPVAYVGTLKDLTVGSYTNALAQQTTVYPSAVVYGEDVYVLQRANADVVRKYKRTTDGGLIETGNVTMPASSNPDWIEFESSTKAYISLFAAGKIAVINPSTMTIISYIDLTSYAIGDVSPDPNVMAYRNGKLYVACAQTSNGYTSTNPAQILVIDTANGNTITSVTDSRTHYAANTDSPGSMFFTENGDFYMHCVSSWGYAPGQKAGFLRIKSGQTIFDPTYFFNTSDYSIADITGNHIDYLQHPIHTGNGIVYSAGNVPALASNPPDYVNDKTFGSFRVDVINQTITKLSLPYSNGYAACVLPFEDKILFGLSTSTGVGIYTYDIATNTSSDAPVVTTQGDPNILLNFE